MLSPALVSVEIKKPKSEANVAKKFADGKSKSLETTNSRQYSINDRNTIYKTTSIY